MSTPTYGLLYWITCLDIVSPTLIHHPYDFSTFRDNDLLQFLGNYLNIRSMSSLHQIPQRLLPERLPTLISMWPGRQLVDTGYQIVAACPQSLLISRPRGRGSVAVIVLSTLPPLSESATYSFR